MRTFVAVLALIASSLTAASAQPAQRCSRETFAVGGQAVAVTVCAAPADGARTVPVAETFKAGSGSFTHTTSIEILPGASASRAVDDVSLSPLGLSYTLHLTLAYRDSGVAIEHALLLPGAVPLK
jgi:hypothetical protein